MRARADGLRGYGLWIAWGAILVAGCDGPPAATSTLSDGVEGGGATVLFSTLTDDVDQCPDDPEKMAPGVCGCGEPDTDADSDGAADCVDDCPFNAKIVQAGATIDFAVSFNDPNGLYADFYDVLTDHVRAAGDAWAKHLVAAKDVTLEVRIHFADIYTAHGGSAQSVFRAQEGELELYEQGAASEVRTGIDPNGDAVDANITIGISNLTEGRWWFDPDPWTRDTPAPEDRIDAFSTFLHEMGHVFAYNGWRDYYDGELPGAYESTFDANQVFDGEDFYFVGPAAMAVYGGRVPLTFGNVFHLANRAPRPGEDLLGELMNGVADRRGWRRYVSDLDVAILADVGLPVRDPKSGDGCEDVPVEAGRFAPARAVLIGPPVNTQETGGAPATQPQPPRLRATPTCSCGERHMRSQRVADNQAWLWQLSSLSP